MDATENNPVKVSECFTQKPNNLKVFNEKFYKVKKELTVNIFIEIIHSQKFHRNG